MRYMLSEGTAQKLKLALGQQHALANPRGPGTGGGRWVLVEALNGEPAGGSGAAAQCYSAAIHDPHTGTTASATEGLCWLTVLGANAESIAPAVGTVYLARMTGDLEIGGDMRPRVYAAANGDEDGFGGGGVGRTLCADYTTQQYDATLNPDPSVLDGYGQYYSRHTWSIDSIDNIDGDASNNYKTGRKVYILWVPDENTGAPLNVVCIPPNSGTWVVRWCLSAQLQHGLADIFPDYLAVAAAAHLVAVDAAGEETAYVDGRGETVSRVPLMPIKVFSGQLEQQGDGSYRAFGDVQGSPLFATALNATGIATDSVAWAGTTGMHEKLIVSGDETIRLALRLDFRWVYNDDPNTGYSIGGLSVYGWGQSGTSITIEQVSTAGCVGCGSGSGSVPGSGSAPADCCDDELAGHPNLPVNVPDGPNAGTLTAEWVGYGWRFAVTDSDTRLVLCSGGAWTLDGNAALTQACNPFLATFDGSILGATGDITVEAA